MGAGGHDDVADLDLRGDAAGSAHPDDPLHSELAEQLGGIDREGGLPHARAHDTQRPAVNGSGEAQHSAHVGDQAGVVHEGLGDALGSPGIARHEDGGGEVFGFCGDVRGGHGVPLEVCGTECRSVWHGTHEERQVSELYSPVRIVDIRRHIVVATTSVQRQKGLRPIRRKRRPSGRLHS